MTTRGHSLILIFVIFTSSLDTYLLLSYSHSILYCIGGGIPKDLPEFNFISIRSEKKLNNSVNCIIFFLTIFKYVHRIKTLIIIFI